MPDATAGPLVRWVAAARSGLAERHRLGFEAVGADDVAIVEGSADGRTFGARLRDLVEPDRPGGLVVLGSGAIPLASATDRRAFVLTAGSNEPQALANNRYSADIVAIARSDLLPTIRICPAITPCRAGCRKSPATASRICGVGGVWRSTSMARWTFC